MMCVCVCVVCCVCVQGGYVVGVVGVVVEFVHVNGCVEVLLCCCCMLLLLLFFLALFYLSPSLISLLVERGAHTGAK
jgi:hypothetical protein